MPSMMNVKLDMTFADDIWWVISNIVEDWLNKWCDVLKENIVQIMSNETNTWYQRLPTKEYPNVKSHIRTWWYLASLKTSDDSSWILWWKSYNLKYSSWKGASKFISLGAKNITNLSTSVSVGVDYAQDFENFSKEHWVPEWKSSDRFRVMWRAFENSIWTIWNIMTSRIKNRIANMGKI